MEKAAPHGVAFFKRKKSGTKPFFSIILLLLLSARTDKKKGHTLSSEPQPLTFGLMPSFDGLPYLIAARYDVYDSLDIKINFITYASVTDRDAAFLPGKLDGMFTDYPCAALSQAKGIRLCLVTENDDYLSPITSKKYGIRNPEDLKGKNTAISCNTLTEYAIGEAMKQARLTPGEANKPEINNIFLRLMMLENGQITASFLPGPATAIAVNNGHTVLLNTIQMGVRSAGVALTEEAIKGKNEEIRRLITGYNLGMKYLQTYPRDKRGEILTQEFGLPETVAAQVDLPDYRPAMCPSPHDIKKAITWLKNKGAIPSNYQGENSVDTAFIPGQFKP